MLSEKSCHNQSEWYHHRPQSLLWLTVIVIWYFVYPLSCGDFTLTLVFFILRGEEEREVHERWVLVITGYTNQVSFSNQKTRWIGVVLRFLFWRMFSSGFPRIPAISANLSTPCVSSRWGSCFSCPVHADLLHRVSIRTPWDPRYDTTYRPIHGFSFSHLPRHVWFPKHPGSWNACHP